MNDPPPLRAQAARFGLAPPRRFLLPAVLLLVAERPTHGYQLVKELNAMRFGSVDRPSVYRALAQLEADGLVEAWNDTPVAGSLRRVYGMTPEGGRVLRAWMGVIKAERDGLDDVLRRYLATGAVDAVLAEAESELGAVGGTPWSSESPTSVIDRRRHRTFGDRRSRTTGDEGAPHGDGRRRYHLVPDRSAVLIEARSTVGPISFGAVGVSGSVEIDVSGGAITVDRPPRARLDIPVEDLRSGNRLYDAELLRRIDAKRFPIVTLDLEHCTSLGVENRFRISGSATLHGVTRPVEGTVRVTLPSEGGLVVQGEQVFDIRDFGIESPMVLMLRIYPEVTVRVQLEAAAAGDEAAEEPA